MTTQQTTPPIGHLLREKRGEGTKADALRAIGVSRPIYDAWEAGLYIPGDEWAEGLAAYLDRELADIVMILYRSRISREAPMLHVMSSWVHSPGWFDRPIDVLAAA